MRNRRRKPASGRKPPKALPGKWTEVDVREAVLDPRLVGVGGFPVIIDEARWLRMQVEQIRELGAETYVQAQLDVMRDVFTGYAKLVLEQLDPGDLEHLDDEEGDPRSTDEIRQDYANKKKEFADDPMIIEVCDAGLALLEAEIAVAEAPLGHRAPAKRALRLAEQRMDRAMQALESRGDLDDLAFLREWEPDDKAH